jgi:hypothetical protein
MIRSPAAADPGSGRYPARGAPQAIHEGRRQRKPLRHERSASARRSSGCVNVGGCRHGDQSGKQPPSRHAREVVAQAGLGGTRLIPSRPMGPSIPRRLLAMAARFAQERHGAPNAVAMLVFGGRFHLKRGPRTHLPRTSSPSPKTLAREGLLVTFGMRPTRPENRVRATSKSPWETRCTGAAPSRCRRFVRETLDRSRPGEYGRAGPPVELPEFSCFAVAAIVGAYRDATHPDRLEAARAAGKLSCQAHR